jgi:hypothetical protein
MWHLWAHRAAERSGAEVEDTAEIGLRFASGICSLHLDYRQRPASGIAWKSSVRQVLFAGTMLTAVEPFRSSR